jgi:MoaA/NifB/PqqE/SkfB family radical SAM enzyme
MTWTRWTMARIVLELTNRCNLRCRHCYDERHAATAELPLPILDGLLSEAAGCGVDHLTFSGGEPTLHRHFATVVERVCAAGYTFSFVSNGFRFPTLLPMLLRHRASLRGVTFSLDGADEATHDRLRGAGSYRQVMRAATAAFFAKLPFSFNCVLTRDNVHEVEPLVALAARLGSAAVRFGHLMFTADATTAGLVLSPAERHEVEQRIWTLRKTAPVTVAMAPGYFSDTPLFPCGPLELEEFHVDHRGNLTLCCHLSGYAGPNAGSDVIANLTEVSFVEALTRFRDRVTTYLADKRERVRQGTLTDVDHFPCWYCMKYTGNVPRNAAPGWHVPSVDPASRRIHVVLAPYRPA